MYEPNNLLGIFNREDDYNDFMNRFKGQKADNWHAICRAMKELDKNVPKGAFDTTTDSADLIIECHKFYETLMLASGFTRENSPELYKAFDEYISGFNADENK